jgi:hypothetical protein
VSLLTLVRVDKIKLCEIERFEAPPTLCAIFSLLLNDRDNFCLYGHEKKQEKSSTPHHDISQLFNANSK